MCVGVCTTVAKIAAIEALVDCREREDRRPRGRTSRADVVREGCRLSQRPRSTNIRPRPATLFALCATEPCCHWNDCKNVTDDKARLDWVTSMAAEWDDLTNPRVAIYEVGDRLTAW